MSETRPALVRRSFSALRERPALAGILIWLLLVTILAALPFAPEGPHDPRTWRRSDAGTIEFPAAGALVEPVASLGHAIAGAPDMRVAAVSTLLWVLVLGGLVSLIVAIRRGRAPVWIALRTLGGTGAWLGVFLAWVGFSALVRLPSWRFVRAREDIVVADLQSHTFGSHDGLVSARESLAWHTARGYHVVAVTEHNDPAGAYEAQALAEMCGLPVGVIPGIEWCEPGGGGYLLAIGLDGDKPPPTMARPAASAERFIRETRADHGGATLALAWRLKPEDVARLADVGLDGFEISNSGHPDIPDDVREALFKEAEARGLLLVSSTDWHGWGGFARTWTAFHVPGAADMTPPERARAVLRIIRDRRTGDVTPVTAGYMGPPSTMRALFSPFAEFARYAMELGPARVAAWWIWAAALIGIAGLLRRARIRPGRAILAAFLTVLGGGLAYQGTRLLGAWAAGARAGVFLVRVGGWGLGIGFATLVAAAVLIVLEFFRRRRGRADSEISGEPALTESGAE